MPSPVVGAPPGRPTIGFGHYLLCFVFGICIGAALVFLLTKVFDRIEDSAALRLPAHFAIKDDKPGELHDWYPIGAGNMWGFIGRTREDAARAYTRLDYTDKSARLLYADVLVLKEQDVFEVVTRWDYKDQTAVSIAHDGDHKIEIREGEPHFYGKLIASGTQTEPGVITFYEVEGLKIATLRLNTDEDPWSVEINHPSRIPSTTFAFILAYKHLQHKLALGLKPQ